MLRKPLRRALVLFGALPITLAAVPSAHAATPPSCPRPQVHTQAGLRVGVSAADAGRLVVCADHPTLGGVIVAVSLVGSIGSLGTPPSVTRGVGDCAGAQVSLATPVALNVAAGVGQVCVGLNGLTATVTHGSVGYAPPQVWTAGTGDVIDYAFCADEYAAWLLSVEPAPEPWTECVSTPQRIV